jgi:hypothetical protein
VGPTKSMDALEKKIFSVVETAAQSIFGLRYYET